MESQETPGADVMHIRKTVRFSAADWDTIREKMGQSGEKNFSRFVRKAVFDSKICVQVSDEKLVHAVSHHLSKIGNNINQIARKVNTDSIVNYSQLNCITDLLGQTALLLRQLGSKRGGYKNLAGEKEPG